MNLSELIDQGEILEKNTQKRNYNREAFEEKSNRWIGKSISYLKEHYPESVLINDFISESEKSDKNYHSMVAILKGLKDVEEELGLLDE